MQPTNFTPLDVHKLTEKKKDIQIVLLFLMTVSLLVLVILLFLLIQKKLQTGNFSFIGVFASS